MRNKQNNNSEAEADSGGINKKTNKNSKVDAKILLEQLQTRLTTLESENGTLKKNQLFLKNSFNYYRFLFDHAPIGYLILDDKKIIKNANLSALSLLSSSISNLKSKPISDFLYPDEQKYFSLFLNHLNSASTFENCRIRILPVSGKPELIGIQAKKIKNESEELETWLGLCTLFDQNDEKKSITLLNNKFKDKLFYQNSKLKKLNEDLQQKIIELKQANFAIQEQTSKLNSIFNATVDGIITIDATGTIISTNQSITAILGFQETELIGANISKIMPSPHNLLFDSYLKNLFQTGKTKFINQVREVYAKRKNGSLVPVEVTVSEYHIDNKPYFTGIIRDISDRKRKEQLDKQHLDELAHVTRLGLMGELASGIAHEINQPLSAIAAYSQVIIRLIQADQPDLQTIRETLKKIAGQALRAGNIIRRMREFITPQTKHLSTVDINQLVLDSAELCSDSRKQKNIKVKFDLEKSLPSLAVDHIQIEQVIINLIKNSIDALSTLPNHKPRLLTIETYHDKKLSDIEVRIKDNGPGIDDAEKNKLFNPFYTTKTNGMGMGLSICRSIIEAHNGILRFNTKKGKGSTFYFSLPIKKEGDNDD